MEPVKIGNTLTLRMPDGNVIQLERYDTLPSTAALAREYAKNGYPDKYVIFAEHRIHTESTSEKEKDTEIENGIFMSCLLRPSFFPSQASFLGVLTSVAMIEALEEHTNRTLGLGWGCDLYCEGKVFANATLEGKLDSFGSYEYLIVTFQILLDDENFPPRMVDIVRKVFESDGSSISMIIAKNVLAKFFSLYPSVKNPAKFFEIYRRKFILRGVYTKYIEDGKRFRCRILGVDPESARLIIETHRGDIQMIDSRSRIVLPKKIRIKKNKLVRRA